MADSIVTCPGCEKKYRIREGSQTGAFVCTACGEQVSVGAARGSPAMARPAQARKPARKPTAAARKAKVQRTRPASVRESAQKKQPVGLYLGLAGVAVVFIAVIVIIVMNTDDPPPPPRIEVAEEDDLTVGIDPNKKPERPPALRETPEDGTEEPDSGTDGSGAPGTGTGPDGTQKPEQLKPEDRTLDTTETDPYKMTRGMLIRKKYADLVDGLKHLDGTPQDIRNEIDKHCATLVDFQAGGAVNDAQDRLVEIGKPAVPRILAAFSKAGDLSTMEGVSNAYKVDETLRKICGTHSKTDPITPFGRPSKSEILRTAKYWCAWWFTNGHKMDKFIEDDPEEEDE